MFASEFIKSMNCNFERIKLSEKPEERRYQYCIISRGGIRGLLSCSLRVIDGDAYLYYDITSKQGLSQMFHKKQIDRKWIKDFVWNLKKITQELNRFLLDANNIIWYPDNIFQDIENNKWSFLYYPYYKGDNGFRSLLEFIIEKIDYKDETLVDCVYKIYEQYDSYGNDYLAEKIYQDIQKLDETVNTKEIQECKELEQYTESDKNNGSYNMIEKYDDGHFIENAKYKPVNSNETEPDIKSIKLDSDDDSTEVLKNKSRVNSAMVQPKSVSKERKGLLSFLDSSRKKDKELRDKKKRDNHYLLDTGNELISGNVAEDVGFYKCDEGNAGIGKTVYIEQVAEEKDDRRRLFDSDGKMLCLLEQESVVIGKKSDESDMVINNSSVSRVHARIFYSNGDYMLEDLNSTNGTFKNGLRLRPYETRKLMQGDEIKLGSVALMYN